MSGFSTSTEDILFEMDRQNKKISETRGRPLSLRDIKRLPIDISGNTLMDPVNIPSKFKLFQATTDAGNLFAFVQYNLADGVRISGRSIDSRVKLSYDLPNHSTHIKSFISSGENARGVREHQIGVMVPNLYSSYKTRMGSVVQFGVGTGLRMRGISSQQLRVSPFLHPKLTVFGPFGWWQISAPLNRNAGILQMKHHIFFSIRGTTMLSSLELSSSRLAQSINSYTQSIFNNNSSSSSSSNSIKEDSNSKLLSTSPKSTNSQIQSHDTVEYKIVHVASATELGVRRTSNKYASKWELLLGLKHNVAHSVFIQCLFTHTIGERTDFALSLGLDL
ncbi:hypothetical protein PPL_09099 [Heterostelium album PN500]|uniref:Uncharacterized protein n=1 Tax=Heterostelium pallidum (strain ATCC 26659 / Pp 5 / PN500) TaxID=670386 RepID=D3BKL7_HETP5|nr:hypothetical protein PPL_09099 [Heterostelium album PN500]EFA78447.1 hypothetical protein PPL_09099 [Heterostelium album PN500]|eukprot:XP_020430572.1 hypothetical protein PPL_09099 [Heterostelium album PN500]